MLMSITHAARFMHGSSGYCRGAGHVHIEGIEKTFWAPTRMRQPFPSNATFHAAPVMAYHSLNGALHALCGLPDHGLMHWASVHILCMLRSLTLQVYTA